MTASTFRDGLRALADSVRGIAGEFGLNEHSAELLLESWSGEQPGQGTVTTQAIPLTVGSKNPKIRWLNQKEIAVSGMPVGTVEIGPLTPQCRTGGIDLRDVLGTALAQGETRLIRITGPRVPDGPRFAVSSIAADRAYRLTIQAIPAGA